MQALRNNGEDIPKDGGSYPSNPNLVYEFFRSKWGKGGTILHYFLNITIPSGVASPISMSYPLRIHSEANSLAMDNLTRTNLYLSRFIWSIKPPKRPTFFCFFIMKLFYWVEHSYNCFVLIFQDSSGSIYTPTATGESSSLPPGKQKKP